jgi:hypothetical protein
VRGAFAHLPRLVPAVVEELGAIPPNVPAGQVVSYANRLYIGTLEGVMRADPGDWIIRGVNGELYPCKPDIFEQTYEAVL